MYSQTPRRRKPPFIRRRALGADGAVVAEVDGTGAYLLHDHVSAVLVDGAVVAGADAVEGADDGGSGTRLLHDHVPVILVHVIGGAVLVGHGQFVIVEVVDPSAFDMLWLAEPLSVGPGIAIVVDDRTFSSFGLFGMFAIPIFTSSALKCPPRSSKKPSVLADHAILDVVAFAAFDRLADCLLLTDGLVAVRCGVAIALRAAVAAVVVNLSNSNVL